MSKRLIAAAFAAAALLFTANAEAKHGKMMMVEMIKSQEVTLPDGKKAMAYVVKMNGEMMVGIVSDENAVPKWFGTASF